MFTLLSCLLLLLVLPTQWYTKCFLPLLDGLGISTKRCRSMTFFDMFHHWNERLKFFTAPHGLRACSLSTMFPTYQQSHGVVGALNWFGDNPRQVGRPAYPWDSTHFVPWKVMKLKSWKHCHFFGMQVTHSVFLLQGFFSRHIGPFYQRNFFRSNMPIAWFFTSTNQLLLGLFVHCIF